MKNKCLLIILLIFCGFSFNLQAKDIGGCFQATESCEAFQSFRKKTNPGNVRLDENTQYKVLESSKKMKAYRVEVNGIAGSGPVSRVKKSARWVTRSCGDWLKSCTSNKEQINNTKDKKKYIKTHKKPSQYLLALTWLPSFCEGHPRKKECRTQTTNRYDAKHWSLHGLWPQPRNNSYCGVSDIDKGIDRNSRWHLLEPVKLSQKTAQALAFTMPGMASNLHRHEWIKHGTCYGKDAESYYADSIYLTEQINNSAVGILFSRNIGKRVSLKEVRQRFDQAFGKGAGKKVNLRCDRKGLISELWINLSGDISGGINSKNSGNRTLVSSLLENAIDAGSTCKVGLVDRANK